MSGWGLSPWGLGPWGGGASVAFSYVFAAGPRVVRATFTAPPQARSPYDVGDALNPTSWLLQRLTPTVVAFEILSIAQVSELVFDILTLAPLGPRTADHKLTTQGLLEASGTPAATLTATFAGLLDEVASTTGRIAASRRYALRDLANSPTPHSPAGTMLVVGGDYAMVEGTDLLRKLLLRRLLTRPGGFFHLPDYGLGLRAKDPMVNLVRFKAELERQAKREPEVEAVRATVSSTRDGVLFVNLAVQTKRGESFNLPMQASSGVEL